MKKKLLLLASAALLLTTYSFADCRRDTVNQFNVFANNQKAPTARWISTFDSRGNQLTEQYQFYSNSAFENSKLTTKTYNANDRVLSNLEQTYDAGNSQWVNNKKFELSYSGNNVADSAYFTWSAGASSWTEDVRLTYTYNGQGKLLSSIYKNQTVNSSKREFTYDATGNETKNEFFSWSSGAWLSLGKEEKTYNAGNKVLVQTNFSYDQGTSSYINGQQLAYTYDANGNETQKEFRDWNGSQYTASKRDGKAWDANNRLTQTTIQYNSGSWTTVERDVYAYNTSNLISEMVRFRLQGNPPTLQIDSRLTYDYNANGLLTNKSDQKYITQSAQYNTTYNEARTYSATGKLTRVVFGSFTQGVGLVPTQELIYEFDANDDLIATETKNGFNVNTNQWNSIVRQEFVCGVNQVSRIAELNNIQFSLYPNPAVGSFLLESDAVNAMVTITDLIGKVVFEKQLEGDKIDLFHNSQRYLDKF